MEAAREGWADVVELLLGRGAAVDHEDEDGWTPLTLAARGGHIKVAELLLGSTGTARREASLLGPFTRGPRLGHLEGGSR